MSTSLQLGPLYFLFFFHEEFSRFSDISIMLDVFIFTAHLITLLPAALGGRILSATPSPQPVSYSFLTWGWGWELILGGAVGCGTLCSWAEVCPSQLVWDLLLPKNQV